MYTYFQIQDKSCICFVSLVYTCRYSLGNYCPALIVSGFHCWWLYLVGILHGWWPYLVRVLLFRPLCSREQSPRKDRPTPLIKINVCFRHKKFSAIWKMNLTFMTFQMCRWYSRTVSVAVISVCNGVTSAYRPGNVVAHQQTFTGAPLSQRNAPVKQWRNNATRCLLWSLPGVYSE